MFGGTLRPRGPNSLVCAGGSVARCDVARPTDDSIIQRFRDVLVARGGNSGNYAMMSELDLSDIEYWRIRNKLLDAGAITLGRGRGGSVILVQEQRNSEHTEVNAAENARDSVGAESNSGNSLEAGTSYPEGSADFPDERSLYAPCLAVLQSQWAKEQRLFDFRADVTADQGRRKTGGIWTRPDIAAVSLRTFPYWPGRYFDLWTFEIKARNSFNVIGLFEALAHARSSTHSWALYHVDQAMLDRENDIDRMTSEALRLGVGLILFTDPADFATWDIRASSVRTTPDPALHDEFVKTQLSENTREFLLQWAR